MAGGIPFEKINKSIPCVRLRQERKAWRKNHPLGFEAKPEIIRPGDYVNLMTWECIIPGKEGTIWEGGRYPLTMYFDEQFPAKPPKCKFPSGFFHPNVHPSGVVCSSILDSESGWRPHFMFKHVLLAIQDLLANPNPCDPTQPEAAILLVQRKDQYDLRIRQQADRYSVSGSRGH